MHLITNFLFGFGIAMLLRLAVGASYDATKLLVKGTHRDYASASRSHICDSALHFCI